MSLETTRPADVADLFVSLCERLREMGATRVEGFGLVASFSLLQPAPVEREERRERDDGPKMTPEEAELAQRLKQLARIA